MPVAYYTCNLCAIQLSFAHDEGSPVILRFHAHLALHCTASVRNKEPATISTKNLLADLSQSFSSFPHPHVIFFNPPSLQISEHSLTKRKQFAA